MPSPAHSALYLSIPFCRAKCSFCNFASGVHSAAQLSHYVSFLCEQIVHAPALARSHNARFDPLLDSIYFGGGTPSLLSVSQLDQIFAAIHSVFEVSAHAEITIEVAPTTLADELLAAMQHHRVNRVSLGVQSFEESEARAVGRRHSRPLVERDIARLRAASISEISIDLIAGLPLQTEASWQRSLDALISSGVPHSSVYMFEIDDDSRLGRELLSGGSRYHAAQVPVDEQVVAFYEQACEVLHSAGLEQYEISNFARPGHESRHNLRYWQRQPYFGFGLEAHSMLLAPVPSEPHRALRLAWPDSLDALTGNLASPPSISAAPPSASTLEVTTVSERQAIEETYFLGLRMNRGLELVAIKEEFGIAAVDAHRDTIAALISRGLLAIEDGWLRLTPRGRLLSNEVFAEFLND